MSFRHAIDTYRGHTVPHFHFTARRNVWFGVSGVVILLSLLGLFVKGLNYSIDFKGGTEITYTAVTPVTVSGIDSVLSANGHSGSAVQIAGSGNDVTIRTQTLGTERQNVLNALAKQAGIDPSQISEKSVGATWGAEISSKALRGLIIVLLAISIYITVRFEWMMAVGAMIALLHDLIITAGIYALTGRSVTPETVIAILTILGFSLYDTVVIYDKISENTESVALVAKYGYSGVVDMSLNQVLMRSVNTSLVVLLPIMSLMFFGGETLKDFAFAMFIGVTTGAYSSIFIAAPILTILKERDPRYAQMEARRQLRESSAARSTGVPVEVTDDVDVDELDRAGVVASTAAATAVVARNGGARPRPKSKRKPPAKRRRR
jgi:preprotein translocase subunit SecF